MRRILVAGLFLTSTLLTAQTATKGQSATMEARNDAPHALAATAPAQPVSDVYATARPARISTGLIEPKLIKQASIDLAVSDFPISDLAMEKMVLHLEVGKDGAPRNIQVVEPVSPNVDARVVAAVKNFRFAPAQLDGETVASDMNLVMKFQAR